MAMTSAEKKRAERARKRKAGLIRVNRECWVTKTTSVRAQVTLASMRDVVAQGGDITLYPGEIQDLLEYFGASRGKNNA